MIAKVDYLSPSQNVQYEYEEASDETSEEVSTSPVGRRVFGGTTQHGQHMSRAPQQVARAAQHVQHVTRVQEHVTRVKEHVTQHVTRGTSPVREHSPPRVTFQTSPVIVRQLTEPSPVCNKTEDFLNIILCNYVTHNSKHNYVII